MDTDRTPGGYLRWRYWGPFALAGWWTGYAHGTEPTGPWSVTFEVVAVLGLPVVLALVLTRREVNDARGDGVVVGPGEPGAPAAEDDADGSGGPRDAGAGARGLLRAGSRHSNVIMPWSKGLVWRCLECGSVVGPERLGRLLAMELPHQPGCSASGETLERP